MAEIPTKTVDRVSVVSWLDPAIDYDDPNIEQTLKAYFQMTVPDASTLPMRDGAEPVRYTLRPLTRREIAICESESKRTEVGADGEFVIVSNDAIFSDFIVRHALCEVTGYEGFKSTRVPFYSAKIMNAEALDQLDQEVIDHLASIVKRWSVLEKKTRSRFGSLPEKSNGTRPTEEAPSHLTAAPASEASNIEKCTDAQSQESSQDRSDLTS